MKSGGQDMFSQIRAGLSDLREGVTTGRSLKYAEEDRVKAAAAMQTEIASNKKQAEWIRKNAGIVRGGEAIGNAFAEAIESGQAKIKDFPSFLPQEFAPHDPSQVINGAINKKMADLIEQIPNLSGDEREQASYQLQAYGTMTGHSMYNDAAGKAVAPLNMIDDMGRTVVLNTVNKSILKKTGFEYFKDDAEIADTKTGIMPKRVREAMMTEQTSIPRKDLPQYLAVQAKLMKMSTDNRIETIKDNEVKIDKWDEEKKEWKADGETISLESYPALKQTAMTWAMNDETAIKLKDAGLMTQKDLDEYIYGKSLAAEKMKQREEALRRQAEEDAKKPSNISKSGNLSCDGGL